MPTTTKLDFRHVFRIHKVTKILMVMGSSVTLIVPEVLNRVVPPFPSTEA